MKNLSVLLLASLLVFASCGDDDSSDAKTEEKGTLTLNISGLEDLGNGFAYEGWIIVDGAPVTTGTFTVDNNQALSKTSFEVDKTMLDKATMFVLSIEPSPDSDPAPAATKILAGPFSGSSATLGTGNVAEKGFDNAAGKYILATPTDGADNNETSGIWFLDNGSGSAAVGLTLPELGPGWAYEGWVVIKGTPVTTGRFTKVDAADESKPFSGSQDGPPFPGEDFLTNAPSGLTFPTDIRGGTAVISIEPVPDNSPGPFTLKPLAGTIPTDLADHTVESIAKNLASFPSGTVSR